MDRRGFLSRAGAAGAATFAAACAIDAAPEPKRPDWERRISDIYWINSVAISDDGHRVVAGTFLHDYRQRTRGYSPNVRARFGMYCLDDRSPKDSRSLPENVLWTDEYDGWDGVFAVAISADGTIAAAGGWLDRVGETASGLIRAYMADDGSRLLDYTNMQQRVSAVALSRDGRVLVAAADDVYVFFRAGTSFESAPVRLGIDGSAKGYVSSVAIHPTGTWLAACDEGGRVYVAIIDRTKAAIADQFQWTASEPIPFLSMAIARDGDAFVAGGGNSVFLFRFAAIRNLSGATIPLEHPLAFDTGDAVEPGTAVPRGSRDGRIQENVRWVALSADGTLVTAVANRVRVDDRKGTGVLLALTPTRTSLERVWQQPLDNSPNCTSIDAKKKFVAACDGYPTGKPAKFYLFDATTGRQIWYCPTCNMNWPIAISGNASAIAAGGDDGSVYYFRP
jgi:WD40 repeat protein